VWVAEKRFGPELAGPVSLSATGGGWLAGMKGESVPVERRQADDGSVDWSFGFFDQGRFVGRQARAGAPIIGHWIQPPGVVQNSMYATPARFEPFAGGKGYQGVIEPFAQEASLNIPLIAESGDRGQGRDAVPHLPARSGAQSGHLVWIEAVEVAGEELRFRNGAGELLATGRSVEPGKRFSMVFPRFGATLDFTRRARAAAPTFYPRRSTAAVTTLTRPAETADGWRTAEPGSTGLDTGLLTELVASIAASEPGGLREPYIHGLLIAHRGKLVVEEYFHGFDRDQPHDSRSAGENDRIRAAWHCSAQGHLRKSRHSDLSIVRRRRSLCQSRSTQGTPDLAPCRLDVPGT
jgi:hypothetical protein